MNIRQLVASGIAMLALACSLSAFAQDGGVPTQPYSYGLPLDVAQVISLQEQASGHCQPVQAKMIYLNSDGQLEAITYLKQADDCHSQG
ncbi:DUF2790 domain-containing protein [Pseudomonas sp. PDM14]|uniref:DUF2790 domain-containing protein n=1 Tax=Pseudomonas sp. PDM14 TaxID=2769288 RepID=UPI00177BDCD5|nr:DUF2790 domain-containing protein [Pseudomonas sp. PDM14]MBD9482292.1 DUF2790 domain-containing protein [Pseudomonas sp. PDM14]